MKRLLLKFNNFMRTRYGMDKLNTAILIFAIILSAIANVFRVPHLSIPILLLYTLFFFRSFSTNVYKRNDENNKFIAIFSGVKRFFGFQKRRFDERNTHVYRVCPSCKAKIRLPRKKGSHSVRCPKCSSLFDVNIH